MDAQVLVELMELLAQPDPPDLRALDGSERGSRVTVEGREDRRELLLVHPAVYRAWQLVDRDNERLQ